MKVSVSIRVYLLVQHQELSTPALCELSVISWSSSVWEKHVSGPWVMILLSTRGYWLSDGSSCSVRHRYVVIVVNSLCVMEKFMYRIDYSRLYLFDWFYCRKQWVEIKRGNKAAFSSKELFYLGLWGGQLFLQQGQELLQFYLNGCYVTQHETFRVQRPAAGVDVMNTFTLFTVTKSNFTFTCDHRVFCFTPVQAASVTEWRQNRDSRD